MTEGPYSFLHVEDDPLDTEYVRTQLEESGLPCTITHVESREDYRRVLEEQPPDLILCDYNLPGFDGLEALHMALSLDQPPPFIFLSGGIGEHLAVECLHLGATDYVLKGNPARLIPAVKRALVPPPRDDARRARAAMGAPVGSVLRQTAGRGSGPLGFDGCKARARDRRRGHTRNR
jgi:CheY-like chemotaxis protein